MGFTGRQCDIVRFDVLIKHFQGTDFSVFGLKARAENIRTDSANPFQVGNTI